MRCNYACGSGEHLLHRRKFIGVAAAGLGGAVMAKTLAPEDSPLPGHVLITPGGGGGRNNDAAYLGPRYASVVLGNGQPPQYSARGAHADVAALAERDEFRRRQDERFTQR